MTIQEAIKLAEVNAWVRPVSWRGSGHAICIGPSGHLQAVPSARGGFPWNPRASDIVSDWEQVYPGLVCKEL
jgi:hypothetical protein